MRNELKRSRGMRLARRATRARSDEAGTGDLASKYGQLVPEHEDLGNFRRFIGPLDENDVEDAPEETVEEGQGHGG
jgi:hypothetical protein